ncbi:MAG: ATP phosphoribosyltransferase [Dehalococcoidia bacterium]|nr:ATP phosphoribosyltransferase [Chloroflexota bacterium]MDP6056205.1 ATP phosphoribosyltransferase [Dehalococcoidia bacterium]MDP7262473.1 ATP phosphoribosyltransferase [Dehalococcoidia bacterium]MDP7485035.1 ATP phosphoribosyltransferase [Dehalococcoidia bacterium]
MSSLRFALPSTGALFDGTSKLLSDCGLAVRRANSRRYTADIPSLPGVDILFQRQSDITIEIDGGSADIGIVGLDRYYESRLERGDTVLLHDGLGFGDSKLVIAVPDSWLDVTSMADLADIALEFRSKGRDLRIATKYERLVKRYLNQNGVNYVSMVHVSGGLEAAPVMGYADIIADITATGTTLRENGLRILVDGTVIESQSVIVGNGQALASDPDKLANARRILEKIEASLRARKYQRVTGDIQGESEDEVARQVMRRRELGGLDGPTISAVHTGKQKNWYTVQVLVRKSDLADVVSHFRDLGGIGIAANDVQYVYRDRCDAYDRLVENLKPFSESDE